MIRKSLPVGFDDFKDVIQNKYYYVDKTLFIKELLDMKGQVNLFTRPRRFGKTLNLSMLKYFFENTEENHSSLFQGTKIMKCDQSYLAHMGEYPIISLTLKSMKQVSYEAAFYCLKEEIAREYKRHDVILNYLKYDSDKEQYLRFIEKNASDEEYLSSILFLSSCLRQYYNHKVLILIDEYDVPLESAYFCVFLKKWFDHTFNI